MVINSSVFHSPFISHIAKNGLNLKRFMVHCIFTVRKNNFSIIFIHFNFVETAKQRIFSVQTKTGALAMQMHIEKRRQKNPLMGKTLRITGSSNAQSHSIQFQKALFLFPSLFASKKNCIHLNFSAFTC